MTLAVVTRPEMREAAVMPSTRITLVVEYDGTDYFGSQFQADRPTVQSELEQAILRLTGEKIRVTAASRTDTGVHAFGQVVSFLTGSGLPLHNFVSGLNFYLPAAIAVKTAYRQKAGFHVQRTVVSRQYDYHILNVPNRSPLRERFSYLVPEALNLDTIQTACQSLIGEHDFASFTSGTGNLIRNTVRTVYQAGIRRDDDMVIFSIIANSFLTHQVRNTVGALIRVGLDKISPEDFYSIIQRKKPGLAGPKAPASGLYLIKVNYPQSFEEETNENI
jgi:tRNA pseudouridine38-40 synthase